MGLIKPPKKLSPEFKVARVAPNCEVEIDWSNPLTRGLSVFTLFNANGGTGVHELVAKSVYDTGTNNINNAGFVRAKDPVGKHIRSIRTQNDQLRLHESREIPNGRGTTVMTGVEYNAGNVDHTLLHIGNSVASNNNPLIFADTTGSTLSPGFNSEAAATLNGTSGSIPVGQFTVWGLTFTAETNTFIRFFVDGKEEGTGNQGNTANITSRAWRYANDSGGSRGVDGQLYFYAVWDRRLSVGENKAFSDDPYAILRPKVPQVYFTASGAGAQTLTPTGITSAEVFGTAAVTTGAVTLTPTGIVSAEAFGTATLTSVVTITPSGIGSTESFGTAVVTTGVVVVTPTGIASSEAFGTAVVSSGVSIVSPNGIASEEAFGTAVLTTGAVTVSPSGIASTEAFGTADVSQATFITPTGIASAEAFGTAVITTGAVTVSPTGIGSAEAFGVAVVAIAGDKDIKIDFANDKVLSTNLASTTLYYNGTGYFTID